jgi:hypothetical protein
MSAVALVYLAWAPLGPGPLRSFLRSYREHPSGEDHELVILLNGAGAGGSGEQEWAMLLAEMSGTQHRLLELERPLLDLAAYAEAARRLDQERLCFVNSYSTILLDGWLGLLARALAEPGVGLAGATGSWESQAEWFRGRVRHWPQQLAGLRAARRDYPRFPNPHLRSNAFIVQRSSLLEMGLEAVRDKRGAYVLESGRRSITRRVEEAGLSAVVVGRDSRVYDVEQWPASRTFRSGDQENLIVADNQTRDYQQASAMLRRRLARASWGDAAFTS